MQQFVSKSRALLTVSAAVTAVLLSSTLPQLTSAQTLNRKDETDSRIAAAMTGLHRFQSSRSLDDLRNTSEALYSAVDVRAIRPENVVVRRRSVVAAYAQLLHAIESAADPAYDPSDVPSMCVSPPREPNGRRLPACADPKEITDLATRAQYVAAIDANNAKIDRTNAHTRLVTLEHDTTSLLGATLQRFRAGAPPDNATLDGILRRAGISDSLRAQIDTKF